MPGQPGFEAQTIATFHRAYPAAIPPMRADKAALGAMPVMAYRHCEPMRLASSFGWYAFPAEEVRLRWNGSDVLVQEEGDWQPLVRSSLPGLDEHWDAHAPADLAGLAPPFLSRLPMPGLVQVWTGLLCSTAPGWSILVRPPANLRGSFQYMAHEGIIETDRFRPCPLFMNIQLIATDVDILLPKTVPLLQVQPLLRETYSEAAHVHEDVDGLELTPQEWSAYRQTIRVQEPGEPPEAGHYAVDTRKRAKE